MPKENCILLPWHILLAAFLSSSAQGKKQKTKQINKQKAPAFLKILESECYLSQYAIFYVELCKKIPVSLFTVTCFFNIYILNFIGPSIQIHLKSQWAGELGMQVGWPGARFSSKYDKSHGWNIERQKCWRVLPSWDQTRLTVISQGQRGTQGGGGLWAVGHLHNEQPSLKKKKKEETLCFCTFFLKLFFFLTKKVIQGTNCRKPWNREATMGNVNDLKPLYLIPWKVYCSDTPKFTVSTVIAWSLTVAHTLYVPPHRCSEIRMKQLLVCLR